MIQPQHRTIPKDTLWREYTGRVVRIICTALDKGPQLYRVVFQSGSTMPEVLLEVAFLGSMMVDGKLVLRFERLE